MAFTEGELWARRELEALRAGAFSPAAVAGFLAASARRSAATRAERPDLARQSRRWLSVGAGAWLALATAGCEPFRRRLTAGLGWWAAVALMLDWHLGMFETPDGRPRPLGLADALTLSRAWLVPVIADDVQPAAVLAAAATDVLDGVAARAGEPTRAGRDLEGLVDASASAAALLAAVRNDRIPRAPVALESLRLAAGVAYSLSAYFAQADAPDPALTRATRVTSPIRVAGLLAAGSGRRRLAGTLVTVGSAASLAVVGRALLARPQ